jgi:hypothetical protein
MLRCAVLHDAQTRIEGLRPPKFLPAKLFAFLFPFLQGGNRLTTLSEELHTL